MNQLIMLFVCLDLFDIIFDVFVIHRNEHMCSICKWMLELVYKQQIHTLFVFESGIQQNSRSSSLMSFRFGEFRLILKQTME